MTRAPRPLTAALLVAALVAAAGLRARARPPEYVLPDEQPSAAASSAESAATGPTADLATDVHLAASIERAAGPASASDVTRTRPPERASVEVRGRVVDESGRAIAQALVKARIAVRACGALVCAGEAGAAPVCEATSDAEGAFVCRGPAGDWRLTARAPGMAARAEPIVDAGAANEPVTLVLGAGASVHGIVRDADGAPVAGAVATAVEVESAAPSSARALRLASGRTDAQGRYTIDGLTPRTSWQLSIRTSHAARLEAPTPTYVESEAEWSPTMPRTGALEGRVVAAASGAPVADARVLVEVAVAAPPHGEPRTDSALVAVGEARTEADGRYRIDGLVCGPVRFAHVRAEGFADELVTPRDAPALPSIGAAEVASHTFTLARGASVEGRALRADGVPVAGARVWLFDEGTAAAGARSTLADADGLWRLDDVSTARPFALASMEDGAPFPTVRFDQRAAAGATLRLDVVVAERARVADGPTGAIAGRVLDADDTAVERALVVAGRGSPPADPAGIAESACARATTAADGSFRLLDVPETVDVYVCVLVARGCVAGLEGHAASTVTGRRAGDQVALRVLRRSPMPRR